MRTAPIPIDWRCGQVGPWLSAGALRVVSRRAPGRLQLQFKSKCCAHTAAAGIRRADWREWSRLWRKSGRVYSDVSGIQAHSGPLNGCRASHSRSELLLDLGEKGIYSTYTRTDTREPFELDDKFARIAADRPFFACDHAAFGVKWQVRFLYWL